MRGFRLGQSGSQKTRAGRERPGNREKRAHRVVSWPCAVGPTWGTVARKQRCLLSVVPARCDPPSTPVRGAPFLTGVAAAMEEYAAFKASGMETVWRERWRAVLQLG